MRESACCLPHAIVEIIIAHTVDDLGALQVCSLTCHSWYIAAVPHLHHTLTLGDKNSTTLVVDQSHHERLAVVHACRSSIPLIFPLVEVIGIFGLQEHQKDESPRFGCHSRGI
jgi:hypothetical protein